jgi:hypothetical protein
MRREVYMDGKPPLQRSPISSMTEVAAGSASAVIDPVIEAAG